jgi:hypothetical protein
MAIPKLVLSDTTEPIFVGDTWPGFTFVYKENGVIPDLVGASVRMTLNGDAGGVISLTSTDGHFTISISSGNIVCNKISRMDYPAGVYSGDLEITFGNGDRVTPILVTMFLMDDVTK